MARKPAANRTAPIAATTDDATPSKPRSRCIVIPGVPPQVACGLDATPEQIQHYLAGAFSGAPEGQQLAGVEFTAGATPTTAVSAETPDDEDEDDDDEGDPEDDGTDGHRDHEMAVKTASRRRAKN